MRKGDVFVLSRRRCVGTRDEAGHVIDEIHHKDSRQRSAVKTRALANIPVKQKPCTKLMRDFKCKGSAKTDSDHDT